MRINKLIKLILGIRERNKTLFTVKKAIVIIPIIAIILQSNTQFLGSIVFAEEVSDSASSEMLENLSDEAVATVSGVSTTIFEDSYENKDLRSAVFRGEIFIRRLEKTHYSSTESLEAIVDNATLAREYNFRVVNSQNDFRDKLVGSVLIEKY